VTETALTAKIQEALRHHAPRGRDSERIGPFLATFTRSTDNPYLNYAIPDEGSSASPTDVETLVATYQSRARKPRLEYIPGTAPAIEPVLLAAGFESDGRLPLMSFDKQVELVVPAGIEIVSPGTDGEFRSAAETQWEAYGESGALSESAVDGLRRVADGGGIVLLARDAATGEPAGAGLCTPPYDGVTELTSVGVRSAFRRRGIAAALTNRLARAAVERGMTLVFLMAAGADEARVYARAGFVQRGEVLHISLP
jgi:ribosomal protein S18 acetylase RimI-like enzyme